MPIVFEFAGNGATYGISIGKLAAIFHLHVLAVGAVYTQTSGMLCKRSGVDRQAFKGRSRWHLQITKNDQLNQ